MTFHLAIDIGASGGRHILGHLGTKGSPEEGKLMLEEVYRFSNAPVQKNNALVWDEERLYGEIVRGIQKCGELRKIPLSIGIDTWGVDYVLVDREGCVITPVYAYRDKRTEPFINTSIPFEDLYGVTGIARQPFNTLYQLLADKAAGRLEQAEHLLLLPEYFSYRLTGNLGAKAASEYTDASTTGLLDARKRDWAYGIIEKLGLPARLFKPVREPPYLAGELDKALQKELGFNAQVLMIASHDTASAVAAAGTSAGAVSQGSPPEGADLYISSGTWSLLGIQGEPLLNAAARDAGYTNEGALKGKTRFLKNIMGLWILQQLRHELNDAYSFAELEEMARQTETAVAADAEAAPYAIDVNLPRFLSPPSMIDALKDECRRTMQRVPESPGELAFCAYNSLALSYKNAIEDLERITGKTYPSVSIIGGGSKDRYLNSLTARHTGKRVVTGPIEATATGNLLLQLSYFQANSPNKEAYYVR
jgi:rhamnulokinase